MAYDNTNRWTLNKNDRKEKDTHPDYKGKLNVDGVDYWIDGWIKEGANGKFISGSLKPVELRGDFQRNQPAPQQRASAFESDDDLNDTPF